MEKITTGTLQSYYICEERLYLTKGRKKVVKEGDLKAAELYATPGTRIPEKDAIRFGLVTKKEIAKEKSEEEAKANAEAQAKADAEDEVKAQKEAAKAKGEASEGTSGEGEKKEAPKTEDKAADKSENKGKSKS